MQERHKHRNLNFFSYDSQKAVEGAHAGTRTLSDWNRQISAGEGCVYYINGVKLSKLRERKTVVNGREQSQFAEFENVAELKKFYKKNLFNNIPELSAERPRRRRAARKTPNTTASPEVLAKRRAQKMKRKVRAMSRAERIDLAVEQACLHWHQAGIQHATYQHANKYVLENFRNIGIPEPKCKVNFNAVKGGVKITEENIIRQWNQNSPTGGQPKKHILSDTEQYYVKTHSTYLFTPETIQIQDLVIDCPEKALAPIFDKRDQAESGNRVINPFLRALYSFVSSFGSSPSTTETKEIPSIKMQEEAQTKIELPKIKGL